MENRTVWRQEFFERVEPIRLKEPLAYVLGAQDEERAFRHKLHGRGPCGRTFVPGGLRRVQAYPKGPQGALRQRDTCKRADKGPLKGRARKTWPTARRPMSSRSLPGRQALPASRVWAAGGAGTTGSFSIQKMSSSTPSSSRGRIPAKPCRSSTIRRPFPETRG